MTIAADEYGHIIGVDTHAGNQTYAVLVSATGQVADIATFPNSPAGLSRAINWMNRRAPGRFLVSVEGAGSYGAGLAKALASAHITVYEVRPPRRQSRRGRGKSDEIDAEAAARAVLGTDVRALVRPGADGERNALRDFRNARNIMNGQRTADRLAHTALVRTTALGDDARKARTDAQIQAIAAWRDRLEQHPTWASIGFAHEA